MTARTRFVAFATAFATAFALAAALSTSAAEAQRAITTPKQEFGNHFGDDYFLANYKQISTYWQSSSANPIASTSWRSARPPRAARTTWRS